MLATPRNSHHDFCTFNWNNNKLISCSQGKKRNQFCWDGQILFEQMSFFKFKFKHIQALKFLQTLQHARLMQHHWASFTYLQIADNFKLASNLWRIEKRRLEEAFRSHTVSTYKCWAPKNVEELALHWWLILKCLGLVLCCLKIFLISTLHAGTINKTIA